MLQFLTTRGDTGGGLPECLGGPCESAPDCSGFACLHELGPPAPRPTKWLFLADGLSIVTVTGRTARFDRFPSGCKPVGLHDAIGLELLRCERAEGALERGAA